MRFVLPLLIICAVSLYAYDFKVTIKWDEMAMSGDAEGVLQYYHGGKVEAIRGNLAKPSSDGNVKVNRTLSGGSQEFIINNSRGCLFNIWIINNVADEAFAEEEEMFALSESKAMVWVEDNVNKTNFQVQVPSGVAGLAFRGGAIIDGFFYDIQEMYEQQRVYQAQMVDAVSGKALPGVAVEIKKKSTGETVAMGQTSEDGFFAQKIEDYGKYDVLFGKQGYLSSKHEFVMDLTELPVSMNFAMTPVVQQFRIVLTWGAYPKDLDAHLAGPNPDGGNFHIWWSNKILIGGKNFLDVDDQSSYGPETITIYKPAQGVYTYAVHNFSSRTRTNTPDLSYSGAHVDVYGDGRLQASFDAPVNQKGNVWKIFKVDETQRIIPINQLYDEDVSAEVIH
jgi:hypothetical protein